MKNLKAIHRIINSVWTIEYKHVTSTEVEIIRYSRDDDEGYNKEKELPEGDVIENDKRIATGIKVGDQTFTVINPRYIFSYHDAGIINKARSVLVVG